MWSIILLVFALVLFLLGGGMIPPDPSPWRSRFVCFGLACLAGSELLRAIGKAG